MAFGKIVAERFKKQYFRKRAGWIKYDDWETQPEDIHTVLLELKSKAAINILIGDSWTKHLPKPKARR